MMAFYCAQQRDFWADFKDNMDSLGLMAPKNLFETQSAAVTNLTAILTVLSKLGKTTTVAELVGAGTGLEALAVVGSAGASFYVGALVGSLIVASQKNATCGLDLFDAVEFVNSKFRNAPWLSGFLAKNPVVFTTTAPARAAYGLQAKQALPAH